MFEADTEEEEELIVQANSSKCDPFFNEVNTDNGGWQYWFHWIWTKSFLPASPSLSEPVICKLKRQDSNPQPWRQLRMCVTAQQRRLDKLTKVKTLPINVPPLFSWPLLSCVMYGCWKFFLTSVVQSKWWDGTHKSSHSHTTRQTRASPITQGRQNAKHITTCTPSFSLLLCFWHFSLYRHTSMHTHAHAIRPPLVCLLFNCHLVTSPETKLNKNPVNNHACFILSGQKLHRQDFICTHTLV